MLEEEMIIKIKKRDFESHINKICRANLRKPCKICKTCPFLIYVLDIMDTNGWKYNTEILKYKK